ncbi:MAG: PrgI family protein [Candidatus Kerfeldbacteria bacterium]|nr:PrgI family protein [Candidatus Kerfeldbacteria bacterium]
MQQFVVPQFIDVEDKIMGPITTRQFLIVLAAGLLTFLEYKLADFSLFIIEALVTLSISIVLAFVKVNGMPAHFFLLNMLQNFKRPRVRVWQKYVSEVELKAALKQPVVVAKAVAAHKAPPQRSKLQELALQVDTGGAYQMENVNVKNQNDNEKSKK